MRLEIPEKSPALCASDGTVERMASLEVCRVCSQLTKKCVLSLRIGPPKAPPNWFKCTGGFSAGKTVHAYSASCPGSTISTPGESDNSELADRLGRGRLSMYWCPTTWARLELCVSGRSAFTSTLMLCDCWHTCNTRSTAMVCPVESKTSRRI